MERERAPAAARPWPLLLAGAAVALLVVLAVLHETATPPAPTTPAERAHAIGERLACPICQGETVADSPSVLAQQMRGIIADQIAQGRSDAQIEQYFVDRYGTGILLAPPTRGFSLLAWLLPLALLLFGGGGLALAAVRWSRRGAADALPALTPEEQERYGALLAQRLAEVEAAENRAEAEAPLVRDEQGGDCGRLPTAEATAVASDSPPATAVAVGLAADRSRRPSPPTPHGSPPEVGDATPEATSRDESGAPPNQEARSSAC